jgi:hypothetical protein
VDKKELNYTVVNSFVKPMFKFPFAARVTDIALFVGGEGFLNYIYKTSNQEVVIRIYYAPQKGSVEFLDAFFIN